MIEFIESVKRLYGRKIINKDKLDTWLKDNIITQEEYEYIMDVESEFYTNTREGEFR